MVGCDVNGLRNVQQLEQQGNAFYLKNLFIYFLEI